MFIPVHGDAPYLPDGHCDTPRPQTPYPLWLTLAIFVGVFAVLQWSWNAVRGTWVERLIVHEATVKPAAALIQIISPEAHAQQVATSIKAPGGGLNILNGCEGTEIMFLLVAAFSAVRLGWQQRLTDLRLEPGAHPRPVLHLPQRTQPVRPAAYHCPACSIDRGGRPVFLCRPSPHPFGLVQADLRWR